MILRSVSFSVSVSVAVLLMLLIACKVTNAVDVAIDVVDANNTNANNETNTDDSSQESWSFIVLADWHGAESFATKPVIDDEDGQSEEDANEAYHASVDILSHIKDNYGGDLVLLPGDTNSGRWYTGKFIKQLSKKFGYQNLTSNEAIAIAGRNCYSTTKRIFKKSGYDKVLLAVGDHEIGDNPWQSGEPVVQGLPVFRDAIATQLNQDDNGSFLYDEPIGVVPSRPIGTPYENTSYAHVYKNVMFVTVDVFHVMESDYFDRETMSGGEGMIAGNVKGKHLTWFRDVLDAACEDTSIKHVFVQSHLPIQEPVRKINSSSMPFDKGTDNEFWKLMQNKCVDVYFAGEVHALTATKDRDSNLVQIVSRGNRFSNFIKVDVTDDKLIIEAYNEVGELWRWNKNYTKYGQLTIDKSNDKSIVEGSGALEPLYLWGSRPLISFLFEEEDVYLLKDRQILGLRYDDYREGLIGTKRTIRGEISLEGMENHGTFGRQYDAQIANLGFDETNAVQGNSSGVFQSNTVVAIGSMGPLVAGEVFSLSLFFKTLQSGETVLVSFSPAWGAIGLKDMLLLTLKEGVPVMYTNENTSLKPLSSEVVLNDGRWHLILVRMPHKSCKLSEVIMNVDGNRVDTFVDGYDQHIFFKSTSYLSLGGWGYSNKGYGKDFFPSIQNFVGNMDKFMLTVGKQITPDEISRSSQKNFRVYKNRPCSWDGEKSDTRVYRGAWPRRKCRRSCMLRSPSCWGYMIMPNKLKEDTNACYHFTSRPKPNQNKKVDGAECATSV